MVPTASVVVLLLAVFGSECRAQNFFRLPLRSANVSTGVVPSGQPPRPVTPLEEHAQCFCVTPGQTSGGDCLPYDSRVQATSVEEAMLAFPDLSLEQASNPVSTSTSNAEDELCKTQRCKDCQRDIRNQLSKIGLLQGTAAARQQLNKNNFAPCDKYRFARKDVGVYEKSSKKRAETSDEKDSDESDEDEKHKRDKRQALDNPILGTRFTLSCSKRGVTPDADGTVSLCSSCWVWRQLPANYSPQYINELVCDNADTSCLSGYASCSTGHRTLEVVRNDTGLLTMVTVSAGSNCDCRVKPASAIQSLVSGSGTTTGLPPKLI